jgi:hypothetical protein
MAEREALTAEYVRQILYYNPETGEFRWKERTPDMFLNGRRHGTWNTRYAGKSPAFWEFGGYRRIVVNGRGYQAHRIAWLWMTGELPKEQIDHINGEKIDNRFANLRQATPAQNAHNTKSRRRDRLKGAYFVPRLGKWQALICSNWKQKHLGYFQTEQEAHAAYRAAAICQHGEFARWE